MYYFIVNPKACRGGSEMIWKQLECRLKIINIDYQVFLTQKTGDARQFAHDLTDFGKEERMIIAVGGDGTVNEVLNGISFAGNVTLGYIPIGLGSNYARSLRLPRSPRKCLKRVIYSDRLKYLDYGILSYGEDAREHRRFAVSCGIGLDAAVCRSLLEAKYNRKSCFFRPRIFSYILEGIRQLLKEKPVKGFLILDGVKKVEFNHIYMVAVHIHPYGSGRVKFAPKTDQGEGCLEVCVVHNIRKTQLMLTLMDAICGRIKNRKGVRFYRCSEAQVHTDRPMPVHVDGEDCRYQTDIHLGSVEKKIRMII
ncbi:MAG: diacylglycerol/lipid kinase family protein [Lachnospiraceae bacterium]